MKQKKPLTPDQLLKLAFKTVFISIGIFILIILLALGAIGILIHAESAKHHKIEQIADAKFQQELTTVPEMKVTYKNLWEGEVMVTAIIENKGNVNFWYRENSFSIQGINNKLIDFECFNLDKDRKRTTDAFTTGLSLGSNHRFKKWFPFEVNTLKELSEKYEQIVQIINTFPQKGSPPHPDYMFEWEMKGKAYSCDLVKT